MSFVFTQYLSLFLYSNREKVSLWGLVYSWCQCGGLDEACVTTEYGILGTMIISLV